MSGDRGHGFGRIRDGWRTACGGRAQRYPVRRAGRLLRGRDRHPALYAKRYRLSGVDRLGKSRIELTKNAACSGATTETVVLPPELNSETRLVTLTVGAANLGLSDVAVACLAGTLPDCLKAIGTAQRELGDCPGGESPLGGQLITLYGKVAEKAPNARIVVTGYPLLFEPPADTDDSELAAKIRAINEATTTLNCVIERAVTAAKDEVNIHYVDVTKVFEKHSIGCTNSCTLFIYPAGPEAFHPTEAGYKAYADAIKTKLPNGWLDKPSP